MSATNSKSLALALFVATMLAVALGSRIADNKIFVIPSHVDSGADFIHSQGYDTDCLSRS